MKPTGRLSNSYQAIAGIKALDKYSRLSVIILPLLRLFAVVVTVYFPL